MSEPDPAQPPARVTIHRTAAWDEQSRQILLSIDGAMVGQLLFGQTLTREVPPGAHTLKGNNTLVWKTAEFTIEPVPGQDSVIVAPSSDSPSGCTTTRTSMPYFRANSKSRSSCAGTAMIAPVP